MLQILREKIGDSGNTVEDYGGYEITIVDEKKFPWNDVFEILLDSGFQVWVHKQNSHLQIISKPEVN